jgi:transposase
VVIPYARRTNRLAEKQRQIGWLVGGTVGSYLLGLLKIPSSRQTVLRLIRSASAAKSPRPRIVGVDEWAFCKGHRYGTILVDLERQQVIELLPERTAESLAQWLKAHPEVEIVSRDRASVYRDGIDLGAPNAIQVADRWHLLKNLKEALERLMEHNRACLQAASASISSQQEQSVEKKADLSPKTVTQQEKYSQAARQRRLERYQIVSDLHKLGQGVRAISRATGLAPKTVRKYLDAGSFPEWGTPTRRNLMITRYLPYLKQQWAKGQHNACQLYRDIKAQGFPGSRATVRRWATKMRKTVITPSEADKLAQQAQATFARPCSAQYATWLLLANQPDLSSDKQTALDRILQTSSEVARAYNFAQAFLRIIRQQLSRALDPWLDAVLTHRIPGLVHFARGLKKDVPAVRAALTLPYSNGQVEGQVNRLKLIKRQMYGRANFDLLRLRVLSL